MGTEGKLRRLGIYRDKKLGVGKRIGKNLWLHKSYADEVIDKITMDKLTQALPKGTVFDVVRISDSLDEFCFISSPDFAVASEPTITQTIKVIIGIDGDISDLVIRSSGNDPQIYHHKWLFVRDDCPLFCTKSSMSRSLEWKEVLGVNRQLSSRIGRRAFWNDWLDSVGLARN